jgi:hypothetical protein
MMKGGSMAVCECGCGEELSGKQKRFRFDKCRLAWHGRARKMGQAALGKGLGELIVERQAEGGRLKVRVGVMRRRNVEKNPRLQRLLSFLKSGPKTTIEIRYHMNSNAPSTEVSDLRQNGFDIRCNYLRVTNDGRKVYLYTLVGAVAA